MLPVFQWWLLPPPHSHAPPVTCCQRRLPKTPIRPYHSFSICIIHAQTPSVAPHCQPNPSPWLAQPSYSMAQVCLSRDSPVPLVNYSTFPHPPPHLCSHHSLHLQYLTPSYLEDLHPPKSSSSSTSSKIPLLTVPAGRDLAFLELLCSLH